MFLRTLFIVLLVSISLSAQRQASIPGTGFGLGFATGYRIVELSDMTGDGVPEYAVSRHNDNGTAPTSIPLAIGMGSVQVHDGFTHLFLWRRYGANGLEYYGRGMGKADWNGDGIKDLIAVAQRTAVSAARIDVLDATSGALMTSLALPSGVATEDVGFSISGGDLDNDGRDEIVIGTSAAVFQGTANLGTPGWVVIFSPTAPTRVLTDTEGDFGRHVQIIDDMDFDGRRDILVSAPWANTVIGGNTVFRTGLLRVVSSASLATYWEVRGTLSGETFGQRVCTTPDLNADGKPDLAVVGLVLGPAGTPQNIYILSGLTGALIRQGGLPTTYTPTANLTTIADLDGDFMPELVVPGLSFAAPYVVVDVVSLTDLRHVDRLESISAVSTSASVVVARADSNGNGWPELLVGSADAFNSLGGVTLDELRPSLLAAADGSTKHDLLRVDGGTGGVARRVDLAIGQPFSIGVEADQTTGLATDFIIWGLVGVPDISTTYVFPNGSFLFPPRVAALGLPWLFTLTDSIGYDPAAAIPGFPAPWAIGAPFGLSIPMDFTLQGVTLSGANIDVTNGILVTVR